MLFKLLEKSTQQGIKMFVTGGYSLDALYGKLTRDHRDIDLYLSITDEAKFNAILKDLGFYNSSVKLPALTGRYKPYRAREARITTNHLHKLVVVDLILSQIKKIHIPLAVKSEHLWSGWRDSNTRPHGPKPCALAN